MHKVFNLPNILSMIRVVLTPVFIWLFFGSPQMQIISIIVFTIAALTDAYDGYLARKKQIITKFGAFLDPIADKVLILSVFSVFAYIGFIGWWVVAVFALRDVLITWLRMKLIANGTPLATSNMAKYKTIFQFVAIYLLFVNLLIHNYCYCHPEFISGSSCFTAGFVYLVAAFSIYTAIDYLKPFFTQISYLITTFFYVGYVPFGPGTAASFVTAALTFFLPTHVNLFNFAVILFLLVAGVVCSGYLENKLLIKDPHWIVIDEVLGMYLCLFWLPKDLMAYLILFLLFRFFDIVKIYPVNKLEDIESPGWGVMLDDVAAAGYAIFTALLLASVWFGLLIFL